MISDYTILFTLVYQGDEHRIQAKEGQYYSLMELISDRLGLPGFGFCSGMGSCGSCLVTILDKNQELAKSQPTLSCGVRVDEDLVNTIIVVHESAY